MFGIAKAMNERSGKGENLKDNEYYSVSSLSNVLGYKNLLEILGKYSKLLKI